MIEIKVYCDVCKKCEVVDQNYLPKGWVRVDSSSLESFLPRVITCPDCMTDAIRKLILETTKGAERVSAPHFSIHLCRLVI